MALIDCLAYIALLALILTMAFAAFYRANDYSRDLSRNAADIARTLQAGERWRADVRSSTQPPRLETIGNESLLRLASGAGEVTYAFRGGGIFRQALPNTNWVELLPRAASSRMFEAAVQFSSRCQKHTNTMKTLGAQIHSVAWRKNRRGAAVLVILVLLAAMSAIVIANTHTLHALKQELKLLDERQNQRLHAGPGD